MVELVGGFKTGFIWALGRTAAEPVLSGLGLFRPEYEHHLKYGQCPAGLKGGVGNGER
jgi:NADH:ubiquinone oxidoreductase subunit F (NADH-binding)